MLDPDNDSDLFVLHCIFLPLINHRLSAFAHAWNAHSVRTEHNWSPRKMWINDMISIDNREQTAVSDVIDGIPAVPLDEFGIDEESPLPDEQLYTVDVPETACPLTEAGKQSFLDSIEFSANIDDAIM